MWKLHRVVRLAKTSHIGQYSTAVIDGQIRKDLDYESAKPYSDIPGPQGLPFLGTLHQYKRGPFNVSQYHNAILKRYEEFGPIYKETIAGKSTVHLLHPDFIKTVYGLEGKIPYIPPLLETVQMYRDIREMSPGLGNTNGEEWYRLRTNVNQMMMRPKAMTMFLPHVNEVVDDFVRRLDAVKGADNIVEDLRNEILKWNLESSAMTCFEKRMNCLDSGPESFAQKLIDANATIFALSLILKFNIPWYKWFPNLSSTWKTLLEAEDYFFSNAQRLVDETVQRIKAAIEQGELADGQFGFMTYLMGKKDLSYKDMSIIAMSLFSDGLSTTSPTMLGQLYCIAANPDKQERLREEVSQLAPDPEAPITAEMLNRASYLKACIKEGFRFFPVGTEVSRIPQRDIVIGGYQIPAGTHLELNNNMLLRSEDYFASPEDYIPERWVRGQSEEIKDIHPYLLLPFGHGPRTCAGRRFAEQEMNVVVMKLLQKFRLEWPHDEPMQQRYNVLLTPSGPETIKFTPI